MDKSKIQGRPDGLGPNVGDSQFSKYPTSHAIAPPTEAALGTARKKNKKKKKQDISASGGIIFLFIALAVVILIGINVFLGGKGVNIKGGKSGTQTAEADDESSNNKNERFRRKNAPRSGILKLFAPASNKLIAEVMAEKGHPNQVFQRDVPANENVATTLAKEFNTLTEEDKNKNSLEKTLRSGVSTNGEWDVDEESLEKMESTVDSFKPQRDRIRDFLNDPNAKFEQDMRTTEDGLVPEEKNIDQSWSYLTLEEYAIAEALNEENIDAAVESLLYMLRFTDLAAHAKFPTMRIQAAYMRENTLRILQRLVKNPQFSKEHADKVVRVLRQQLKDWPPDYECWVGDRADGIRSFEMISKGRLAQVLTEDDQNQLKRLDTTGREKSVAKGTDLLGRVAFYKAADFESDMEFYLAAMKKLVDSCTKPFYTRIALLNDVDDSLQMKRGKKDFPAISMLLLQGIREGMQQQAMDKARVEVWYLALASSLKYNVKQDSLDPVSGKLYHITRSATENGEMITVSTQSETPRAQIKAYH